MRDSVVFEAAARCCNTANSSATIDGRFEILNLIQNPLVNHYHHLTWNQF